MRHTLIRVFFMRIHMNRLFSIAHSIRKLRWQGGNRLGKNHFHVLYTAIPGHTEADYWAHPHPSINYQKGLSILEDGTYMIIEQRKWIEQESIGYLITMDEALNEILQAGNLALLEQPNFKELKDLYLKRTRPQ